MALCISVMYAVQTNWVVIKGICMDFLHGRQYHVNDFICYFTWSYTTIILFDVSIVTHAADKTRINLIYLVDSMAADTLPTQGTRASTTMKLTTLKRNNSVHAR